MTTTVMRSGGGSPGVAFGFNGFEWNNANLNSAGNECPNMPSGGCVEKNQSSVCYSRPIT